MNTGQTMLTIGAMAMLLTLIVNWYSGSQGSQQIYNRAKCGLAATSIATSFIEEASMQYFDEQGIAQVDTITSQLTAVASLGPDAGESYHGLKSGTVDFDDFDDYNNFKDTIFSGLPDSFFVSCKVVYVNPATPTVASTVPTWHKCLTVSVTSRMLVDTIKVNYIFSYWYFR